jgi:hypothetical protein
MSVNSTNLRDDFSFDDLAIPEELLGHPEDEESLNDIEEFLVDDTSFDDTSFDDTSFDDTSFDDISSDNFSSDNISFNDISEESQVGDTSFDDLSEEFPVGNIPLDDLIMPGESVNDTEAFPVGKYPTNRANVVVEVLPVRPSRRRSNADSDDEFSINDLHVPEEILHFLEEEASSGFTITCPFHSISIGFVVSRGGSPIHVTRSAPPTIEDWQEADPSPTFIIPPPWYASYPWYPFATTNSPASGSSTLDSQDLSQLPIF